MSQFHNPTRLEIRNRVRFYIDEPVQANFSDNDLNYAINNAQQEVVNEITQVAENYLVGTTPTIIQTVVGQQYYPLAADCNKIVRMFDTVTGAPIPFTDMNSQNVIVPSITSNILYGGNAFNAMVVGNSVGFTPIPSSGSFIPAYYYVPFAADMLADTDTSVIPRNYIDLLAIAAAIDARIKDEDDTTALERKYGRLMEQMKRTARDRQQENPKRVRRVGNRNGI
jgi:hypothetical protein